MTFSSGFLVAPPPAHSLAPSLFGMLKVFRWYKYSPSFIYVWLIIVLEFWNFKCFHTSRKYSFRLLLGGFLDVTHWNVVKFVLNFDQCNVMHQEYGGFYFVLKKHLKLSQKTDFLAHFERFLVYAPFTPCELHPNLLPN